MLKMPEATRMDDVSGRCRSPVINNYDGDHKTCRQNVMSRWNGKWVLCSFVSITEYR